MAASAVSILVKNLSTLIQKEVVLLWGVEEDMRKLSSTLSTILAVLDDAEMKQHREKPIQDWLRKLKDAAYVVSDILDDCETEALKWEIKSQSSGRLKKVWTSAITCYPVVNLYFRHQIGSRMKDVTEHINAIAKERKRFHLNEGFIGKGLALADDSRETSSALPPLELFGRQDDIEKIVEVLTKDVRDLEDFSIYPIIGMGGLGKTTLAQMTFNDDRINSHFVLKIWVYVSQNFDVKQVMKQILESTPGEKCEVSSLDPLQKEVSKRLSGKRFLIVLDDAWSEDQEEWDKLKPALASGLPGSCIVVTTRSEKVTSIVGTLPTHYLSPLSQDDCWLLFRQRAFGPSNEERPDLVDIGKEIVKKCGGVPLAAKALGGLLRFRRSEEWISVSESNLWDIPEGECSILSALRLSYYNLPLELRHCFSYCAIFLKGSKIEKERLIHHWMANGFISSKKKTEVEDVGNQIWNELYTRSFFQDEYKDQVGRICFKMHDLMHDLAQFVMEDECQMMEAEKSSIVLTKRIRHATLIESIQDGCFPEALKIQCSLHTILLQHRDASTFEYSWGLENLGSLRVLDAGGSGMNKLSGSVGKSKHLRYLNLSLSEIRKLPASVCELPNLQTLNLNDCCELRRLPKKMNNLRSLRHLFLRRCRKVEDMPPRIGKLTQLKTLSLFVVGESNGKRVGELQHLNDLGGEIEIKHLERVRNSMEAKEANLAGKPNLRIVRLSWKYWTLEQLVEQAQVIEALEPHPNVEDLTIKYYRGKELPIWMGNPSILKNVTSIELYGCDNCARLPSIWNLPFLKRLKCGGMGGLEYIMIQDGNSFGGFPSLEMFCIHGLSNLKGLVSRDEETEEQGSEQQQQILTSIIFPALDRLEIHNCSMNVNILAPISKLTTLTRLDLGFNEDLVCFPDDMFQKLTRLQTLEIHHFQNLKTLPGNMLSSLVALKELRIESCKELECLPDGGIGSLTSLLNLTIKQCPKIVSLPDSIQTLTQLQYLDLSHCSPELERRCEKGKGEDWYKIAHVPKLNIWGVVGIIEGRI